MAKRKLGASIVILCIAAITLVSGTYAWFLSGGAASLFDIGFDVIESDGSILLKGDAGTYGGGKTDNGGWGTSLDHDDFVQYSFIVNGGTYIPLSGSNFAQDSAKFVGVRLENDKFNGGDAVVTKATATDGSQIHFNDFKFYVKSGGEELVGTAGSGAWMTIDLNGLKTGETLSNGEVAPDGAAIAARAAVTIDGSSTVYSLDGESYNAVTNAFISYIDDVNEDRIINPAEDTANVAGLAQPASYAALKQDGTLVKIYLGNLPNVDSNGKPVTVRIWLEGNDKDCVDFADRTVAGKSLMSNIKFGID